MKLSKADSGGFKKIDVQMAPMIDVVFQLLIFFMLTLKVILPETDFTINMPLTGPPAESDEPPPIPLTVRLMADAGGGLAEIQLNGRGLGRGEEAFDELGREVEQFVGPGGHFAEDAEVTIDADYSLPYRYTMKAVGKCTGKVARSGQIIRFFEVIKFSQPRPPG